MQDHRIATVPATRDYRIPLLQNDWLGGPIHGQGDRFAHGVSEAIERAGQGLVARPPRDTNAQCETRRLLRRHSQAHVAVPWVARALLESDVTAVIEGDIGDAADEQVDVH